MMIDITLEETPDELEESPVLFNDGGEDFDFRDLYADPGEADEGADFS
jgi:hypothetical protein